MTLLLRAEPKIMKRFPAIFMHTITFPKLITRHFYSTISDHIKNQRLEKAHKIFVKIPCPNVHLYTKMITGYTRTYRLKDALQLFDEMPIRDTVAWNSMIKGCLDCGNLGMARELFDRMPERNVVAWTTMISGYMQFGRVEVAEGLFRDMPYRDVAAWNSIIYGYFSNGRVDEAVKVFGEMPCRNVISWTSMISGLDQNGRSYEALRLFKEMVGDGIEPTASTFSCLLTACVNVMAVELGTEIHARIVKLGCGFDEFVTSSLITFYANCKRLEDSRKVFSEKVHDSVVVWTSLLTGYSLNSRHEEALAVFSDMIKMGVSPNESSFTSALNSCFELVALDKGQVIHAEAMKLGFEDSAFVGNSLVTLYSKCGSITEAVKVFGRIKVKNLVSWNSIIVGCAQNGCAMWVLMFFAQMLRVGVEPDEITVTGLLHAASHSPMLLKGRRFFLYFKKYTSVNMNLQHYACMVDIIGRSGNLDEAEDFINEMPIRPNSIVLLELLSACRLHSDFDIAERVSKRILDLEPQCNASFTLMSNICASAGRWDDVARIRSEMKNRKIAKQEGNSWLNQYAEKHDVLSG